MTLAGAWLSAPRTQQAFTLLKSHGYQALAVGGCVRNALLGVPVNDIDIATDARPEQVLALAEAAGVQAVPTGLAHGTVTLVIDKMAFEITTFRADIETDGRHAVVRFSTDVTEDAQRRDFTMNALYAQADGTLLDPLGGLPDLKARKVRFINDASLRVREDYLRSLRYFRFHAWYGDPQGGLDAEALAAIAANLDGLAHLSRERVTAELVKLLAAPDPAPAVAGMAQSGVLLRLLPGADPQALGLLVHLEEICDVTPDPMLRLAALGEIDFDLLRLSKAQRAQAESFAQDARSGATGAELAYRRGAQAAYFALVLRAALTGGPPPDWAPLSQAAQAKFPLSAHDLMPEVTGAALGVALREGEAIWIASGFTLTKAALLKHVRKG